MKNKLLPKVKKNSSPVCFADSDEVRPEFKEAPKPLAIDKKQTAKSKK
jgi:hypothetical protein